MTLADYLNQHSINDDDFAAKIGRDRSSVFRLRKGSHKPPPDLMQKIAEVTDGAVLPNDWFDGLPIQDAA